MNDISKNPFTPIFGKVPPYMAGRTHIIDEMTAALAGNGNDPALVSIFVGARGTGKTALLSLFADMAEEDGWVSARVTSAPGMLDDILARISRSAGHLLDETPKRELVGASISGIGSLEWSKGEPASLNWRAKMDVIFDQLEQSQTGLLITVDEVDSDLEEMVTLVTTFQHFLDEGRKAALLMAGLPFSVTAMLSGKTTSFLRRAVRHDLGAIDDYDIDRAFRLTMSEGGLAISDEAARAAVKAIGGFPYLFQLLGYRAWNFAHDKGELGITDIRKAACLAQREVEERVYEATYYELTPADRDFLNAMLEDDRFTKQSELAHRLAKQSGHVSKYKKRMLKEGIIQERTQGILEFCLPGFKEYFAKREAELGGMN